MNNEHYMYTDVHFWKVPVVEKIEFSISHDKPPPLVSA